MRFPANETVEYRRRLGTFRSGRGQVPESLFPVIAGLLDRDKPVSLHNAAIKALSAAFVEKLGPPGERQGNTLVWPGDKAVIVARLLFHAWELRAGLDQASAQACNADGACFGVQCSASGGWSPG